MPDNVKSPELGIKGQTPQLESSTAIVAISLNEFKENCLPLPDNLDDVMKRYSFSGDTYVKASGIIKSAPNKCEASVEVKLSFESKKGQWTFEKYVSELAQGML